MPPDKSGGNDNVKVVIRCRPLNNKERDDGRQKIVEVDTRANSVIVVNPNPGSSEPPKQFTFDQVFDDNSTQLHVYDKTARPIVDSCIEGYNGTIFAYGQTGTGKTHTMEGKEEPPELRGIIPNTFNHIFTDIQETKEMQFLVSASYLELYNEEIRDLLHKNQQTRLELKENPDLGIYVKDLTSFVVKGVADLNKVLAVGRKNRTVGATLMNQDSSRSHSIFTIKIETSDLTGGGEGRIRVGKLNLVDLAGSERQSKSGATGERLKEATKINLSLSALGNVISALVDGKAGSHIPYRDSKLTRLLQDSLGGNTKTVMVANVGPADWNYDETLSTLRYANRAKNIKNKPKINEDPKDAQLRQFQEEIQRLQAALEQMGGAGAGAGAGGGEEEEEEDAGPARDPTDEELVAIRKQVADEMAQRMQGDLYGDLGDSIRAEAEAHARQLMERMLMDKNRNEEERERIRAAINHQETETLESFYKVEEERKKKETLARRLREMEEKIVLGGSDKLLERTIEQAQALEQQQAELQRQQLAEAAQRRRIQALEDEKLQREEYYSSKQEEVVAKTRKLRKLWGKYQEAKRELNELGDQMAEEKEEMLSEIRELQRHLQLKAALIDLFVPPAEVEKVERRAVWDAEAEEWSLEALAPPPRSALKRPPHAAPARRPTAASALREAPSNDSNPRWRGENILNLELEPPERTTVDWTGQVNPRVQAALDAAVRINEADWVDDLPSLLDRPEARGNSARPQRPGSARAKR